MSLPTDAAVARFSVPNVRFDAGWALVVLALSTTVLPLTVPTVAPTAMPEPATAMPTTTPCACALVTVMVF